MTTPTTTRTEAEAEDALRRFLTWDRERQEAAFTVWGTPPPLGEFVVGPALICGQGRVTFLLWDSVDPPESRFPYRAILVRRPEGTWAIRTIQSQCTACLGTGLVEADSELCDSCNAEGWGVASGRKRTVVVAA